MINDTGPSFEREHMYHLLIGICANGYPIMGNLSHLLVLLSAKGSPVSFTSRYPSTETSNNATPSYVDFKHSRLYFRNREIRRNPL